jgi:hypothetical protein
MKAIKFAQKKGPVLATKVESDGGSGVTPGGFRKSPLPEPPPIIAS